MLRQSFCSSYPLGMVHMNVIRNPFSTSDKYISKPQYTSAFDWLYSYFFQTSRISDPTRFHSYRLRASSLPRSPIFFISDLFDRISVIFSVKHPGSSGFSTTSPFSLIRMTSGFPPLAVVTIGSPEAIAS